MTKIGKKEQLILNRIARKRLQDFKQDPNTLAPLQQELNTIPNWRPPLYKDPEELETLIVGYIKEQEERKKPLTITGLALSIWIDRGTLLDYKKKDNFAHVINKYRSLILARTEEDLVSRDKFTPGQIFYLKNNYKQDYQDKIEIDNKHSWSISLVELSRLASTISDGDIIEWEILPEETLPEETP